MDGKSNGPPGTDADWTVKEILSSKGQKQFQLTLNQELRCGAVDHRELQEAWKASWRARLEMFRDVFLWITPAIKELAGLDPTAPLSSTEKQNAFLASHADYSLGSLSGNPRVTDLHLRQNAAWTELTGLPPLGNQDAWRAAGHAAGAPAEAIEHCDIDVLIVFIKPWAIAKRAKNDIEESADKGVSLRDVGAAFEHIGKDSTNFAKRFSDSKRIKSAPLGNCPKDGRARLYRLSEILNDLQSFSPLNNQETSEIRKHLKSVERHPAE